LKDSYLTAGIKLNRLIGLLKNNNLTYSPATLLRIAFLLQSACWSSVFSFFETIRYSKTLKNIPIPPDPVFIIGHWRTGSTLLHQIMNLDPNLHAPTLFQVAIPNSFLISYPYYRPVFNCVVAKHRPMDMVKLGMDEPQEDEYAIYRLTDTSPLEDLVFPKSKTYFLLNSDKLDPKNKLNNWKSQVQSYFTKLYFHSNKTIVSKNPFNSFRIQLLLNIFPQAKFIHIHRHPYDVIPSTIHMWDIVQRQNCLNNNCHCPEIKEVITVMDQLLTSIEQGFQLLPENQKAEIRFEDLEKNPEFEMKKLYASLNMPFLPEFENKINIFIKGMDKFEKNEFSLTADEKADINKGLKVHMNRLGYTIQ